MEQNENTEKLPNDEPLTRDRRNVVLAKAIQAVDFRPTLTPETDRGCALMAAAYLDSQLDELLRAVFIDDQKVVGALLQSERPLGSFSAKIDMAYSLGLLPADAYRDLHLIRKIRNEFGHRSEPITFNNPEISNRCRELITSWFEREAEPRGRFVNSVMAVLAHIHIKLHRAIRPSVPLLKHEDGPKRLAEFEAKFESVFEKVFEEFQQMPAEAQTEETLRRLLNEALFPQLFTVASARADEPKQE